MITLNRRDILRVTTTSALAAGLVPSWAQATRPVKLGFLTGMTGLETILGETQLNCFKLAVDEINAAGGISGRKIEFVVEDDQTTTRGAIDKARKLINSDKVDVIIGLIASLTHVAARSVTGPAKMPLLYTTYYEGGVCESHFFSTGQIPNQQIVPTARWLTSNVGKSVYVIGSDYIWPRKSTEAIDAAFKQLGGKVLGADFLPFGTTDFAPVLNRANAAKPDMIWVMVAGSDLITMLKQYKSFGMKQQLVSNGLDEIFSFAHPELTTGVISNQAYFMTLNTPKNAAFVKAYQAKFGAKAPVNSIGEATYNAVHLYALAVKKAGSTDQAKVLPALKSIEFEAPQGKVSFAANNVMKSNSLLGRGKADGSWEIIQNFGQIEPELPGCKLG